MRAALAAACLVVLAIPSGARADELHLKNGRTIEGDVLEAGDTVVITRPGITMEIRRDEVKEIRKSPSAREQYEKKAAALAKAEAVPEYARDCKPAAADERHRLGLWCAAKGLKAEAKAEHERAIEFAPDHAGARAALGFVKDHAGKWRPEAEVMREKGLVLREGRWVTPEEAGRTGEPSAEEKARREKKERDKRLRKSLNEALRLVADPEPSVRRRGEAALVETAKEMGDTGLEASAPDFRAYYDRVYEEIESARALMQIRAQVVTLKRPIQKFTTSLGGFGAPVTLQLPELSVISINTTALVPLSVDEE